MNDMKVFENSEFGKLEIIDINGKIHFPATQCAKILGYANPHDALIRHCKPDGVVKREVGVQTGIKADGLPAMQNVKVKYVTEGNLYRLIVNSRLSSAEKFEKWVFDEVIPTIMHTGQYVLQNNMPLIQELQALEKCMESSQGLADFYASMSKTSRQTYLDNLSQKNKYQTEVKSLQHAISRRIRQLVTEERQKGELPNG